MKKLLIASLILCLFSVNTYAVFPSSRETATFVSGRAEEKRRLPGGTFYAIWAGDVVKKEIHKGGWRLAALLEEVLQ